MWAESTKNGKVRFVERYMEPLTGQYRKVSVVMNKNTAAVRKQATEILQTRIEGAIAATAAYTKQDNLTLQELVNLYREYQKSAVSASTYQRNFFATQSILKLLGPSTLVDQLSAGYVKTQFIKNHDTPGTINERMPLQDVQELAGHTSINTTRSYYRNTLENVKHSYLKAAQ